MSAQTVDISAWTKRNLWPSPVVGTLAVRPGTRLVHAVAASSLYVGGFSVSNEFTGEVWHYLFRVSSTAPRALTLIVYDDNWLSMQELAINVDVIPRVITYAVVLGQIIISSPDMPTLWGLVGSGVTFATKRARADGSATAIDIPRGICCAWLNRVVICDGSSMFFSDPVAATGGSPRTFVAQNQNARSSPIYGVHEGAGGQLVVVTGAGVYGLDPAAGAVGVVGSNGTAWQMLSHHKATSFASSCVVNGRVFALTQGGYKLVDVETDTEEVLNDAPLAFSGFSPAVSNDWREAEMHAGIQGPVVVDRTNSVPTVSFHDLSAKVRSWCDRYSGVTGGALSLRGLLYGVDGEEMLIVEGGVLRLRGNMDGDNTLAGTSFGLPATIVGAIPTSAMANPTVRAVHFAQTGASPNVLVNGDLAPASSYSTDDGRCIAVGTTLWSAATRYAFPFILKGARCQFDLNGNDPHICISFGAPSHRIQKSIVVEMSDSAPERANKRGNT